MKGSSFQKEHELIATPSTSHIMFLIESGFISVQITDYRFGALLEA